MTTNPAEAGLKTRRAAFDALTAINDGAWSTTALSRVIDRIDTARDRRFVSHLVYETVRWQASIDMALAAVVTRPLDQIEPALLNVLRLGVAQLLVSRVPARAAVDTSVTLAKQVVPYARRNAAGGFVNGVLRTIARKEPGFDWLVDDTTDTLTRLSVTTGHPAWIVSAILKQYDPEETAAFLHANNQSPGVTLRAIGERDTVIDLLTEHGIEAHAGQHPKAIRTDQFDPSRDGLLRDGQIVVQDEASMFVVDATEATVGDRVLDLCAGPGGKTLDLAQRVGPDGQVVAVELHEHRAQMISDAATRLGFSVDVRVGDALTPPLGDDELFDRVLVDAPCSGTGTWRRAPHLKWCTSPADIRRHAKRQRSLLAQFAASVRPQGRLLYATCSLCRTENDGVVGDFLAAHPHFRPDPGVSLPSSLTGGPGGTLGPATHDTDGFYAAYLRRIS